ncbi:thioredoxin [Candidatus Peregrinibacteria bacterium CG11_big_fil_rev_8_21_14_0_20_41_10]|nr:MAG: thioredoxin [Candidatus Peregrinibacteria bacterium CG11_big_fil_rev_8_21_14_0_20_41_10]
MQVLTDSNFADSISSGTVLVDFFAEWCGPCKMLSPVLEDIEADYAGKITFTKVDVDASGETSQTFAITSVPTIIIFRDGAEIARMSGFQSKDALIAKLNEI